MSAAPQTNGHGPVLIVDDIHTFYGSIEALKGISLEVNEGEIVTLIGANGAGKSTTLRAINGLNRPRQGSIRFEGRDIGHEPTHRRARMGLAYVPQGRDIFPFLTVAENLRMGGAAANLDAIVADFPALAPLLGRQGGSLSGGQQQILAIARCMATRPKCILLDEPTEGIQPSIVEAIADMLARLRATRHLALVIVEQQLEFVAGLAARVLVMQKGTVVKEMPAAGLADRAAIEEIVGMGG